MQRKRKRQREANLGGNGRERVHYPRGQGPKGGESQIKKVDFLFYIERVGKKI